MTEEDGSSRQMLSVTKADGAEPWAGFEFISAYSASDLVGDGTQPVTMRVFADQAGTLTLGLEVMLRRLSSLRQLKRAGITLCLTCPRLLMLILARR